MICRSESLVRVLRKVDVSAKLSSHQGASSVAYSWPAFTPIQWLMQQQLVIVLYVHVPIIVTLAVQSFHDTMSPRNDTTVILTSVQRRHQPPRADCTFILLNNGRGSGCTERYRYVQKLRAEIWDGTQVQSTSTKKPHCVHFPEGVLRRPGIQLTNLNHGDPFIVLGTNTRPRCPGTR